MRRAAAASMRKRGIEVVLGDYVDITETIEVQGLTTRSGKALGSADLVVRLQLFFLRRFFHTHHSHQVQTRGPVPNTAFVAESLGASALSDRDLIRVLPTLQLQEHPSIFAAGDVIEWKEQKQAAKSSAQGVLVGGNVLAYLSGGKMVPYKGKFEMIIATNGKVCILFANVCIIMSLFADGWFRVAELRIWTCCGASCSGIGSRRWSRRRGCWYPCSRDSRVIEMLRLTIS